VPPAIPAVGSGRPRTGRSPPPVVIPSGPGVAGVTMRRNASCWSVVGLLLVAGCGDGGFDRGNGSFDRRRYHAVVTRSCGLGLASNRHADGYDRDAICACVGERLIEGRTDAELREQIRTRPGLVQEIMERCAANATRRLVFDPATGRVSPEGR